MTTALIIVIFLPLLAALGITVARGTEASLRVARCANGIAAGGAIALAGSVAFGSPINATLMAGDTLILGFGLDRLGGVLLPFVLGVGFVVQVFAGRYLRGDAAAPQFFASASVLATATAAMVTASTLIGFAAAWTLASVAVWWLLAMYAPLAAARLGLRRTVVAFSIGDTALWLAVGIVVWQHGNVTLAALATLDIPTGLAAVIAALLLVSALARSAQLPFHRWLPATLAAPTPVSALLHAGVVNAGGILLVRTNALVAASDIVMHLAVAIGAATAVYGTVLMLTKSDVKGALTHSTMGQMGFMIMTCGLGAYGVAIFHLVAHGMYKAALFAGSGGAVRARAMHESAPYLAAKTRTGSVLNGFLAWGCSLAVFLVATPSLYPHASTASAALLVFGWFSAAIAMSAMLRTSHSLVGIAVAVLTGSGAIVSYVALLGGFSALLAPAIPPTSATAASAWFVGALVILLLAAEAIRRAPVNGPLGRLHRELYTLALAAGHVRSLSPSLRAGNSRRAPAALPAVHSPLALGSEF